MDLVTLFTESTIDKNNGQTIIDILDKCIDRDIQRLDNILHLDTDTERDELYYRIDQLKEFAYFLGAKTKFSDERKEN